MVKRPGASQAEERRRRSRSPARRTSWRSSSPSRERRGGGAPPPVPRARGGRRRRWPHPTFARPCGTRPNGRSASTSSHEGELVIALTLAVILAQSPQPVSPVPVAPQPEGKQLFAKAKCIKCHGEDGKGDTEQ